MIKRILLVALAAFALFAAYRVWQEQRVGAGPVEAAAAGGPTREVAFVANAVGGTVTLVDIAARRVLGTLDIVPDGRSVSPFRDFGQGVYGQRVIEGSSGLNFAQDTDLSPDGRTLYVARGHLGDVAAFDLASGALHWRRAVAGVRSDHMAISPDGSRLYVSGLTSNVLDVLDARSGRRLHRVRTGTWPHDVHAAEDGRVFVASLGDMRKPEAERNVPDGEDAAYQLTVFRAPGMERIARHKFPRGIRPFQLAPDGRTVYAQLSNEHSIVAYDLARNAITRRIDLPVAKGVTEDDWDFEAPHHGLALTADGATLCAAGRASDYAALVAAAPFELLAAVPAGDAPSWSAVTSDGRWCVLSNNRSDDVSIVDIAAQREVARLPTGRGPKHITIGRVPASALRSFAANTKDRP